MSVCSRRPVSIVSPEPGTTRDVVEARQVLGLELGAVFGVGRGDAADSGNGSANIIKVGYVKFRASQRHNFLIRQHGLQR